MDLRQNKLTKGEWEALEIPVSAEELKILKLIQDGYENLNIRFNEMSSLINFMKITSKVDIFHEYLYTRYCCTKIFCSFAIIIKRKKRFL